MFEKKDLPKKSENLSDWYNRIVLQAELADYGPAKGTMIFRPYGFALWEQIQKVLDERIKEHGVENAYFPMFIPEALLKKEEKHVEGFSPELAVVTIGGGEELKEKLVVRPTSETIMYDAYARWVHSWRDLPIKINQWNNVVRWEKRTYMFLRTTEFLWQEGHTAHATHEESYQTVKWAIEMYANVYRNFFAIPGYIGKKSESEKFAGADQTLTYEALMPGGKVLQSCTSHDLGQNFSKVFTIAFQNQAGENDFAWQTSWGISTRSIGGLIMMHGDDQGLRLPPKLAPYQVVIIPVKSEEALIHYAEKIEKQLKTAGIRVFIDKRDNESMGFKINKWELKGAPIRLVVGAKEMEQNQVTAARRDTSEKMTLSTDTLTFSVPDLLEKIQANLLVEAENFLAKNTISVSSYDEFKSVLEEKHPFIQALWCEDAACAAAIKEETKATTRCLPLDAKKEEGVCVRCEKTANHRWYFGQAY